MKKIFAIALAVVMVLSMASAFALSACMTWGTNWACTPDDLYCGQGKVEVVPYVKVNTSCGWEYQVSDCAAAIRSTEVFWAIKLTVEAYPDPAWWDCAVLDLETEGLDLNGEGYKWVYNTTDAPETYDRYVFDGVVNLVDGAITADFGGIDYDATTEKVYYLSANTIHVAAGSNVWVPAADAKFGETSTVMFDATVVNANVCNETDYSVCAKLTSEYDGWSFGNVKPFNQAGDYFYQFAPESGKTNLYNSKNEMNGWFYVWNDDGLGVNFAVQNGKAYDITWTNSAAGIEFKNNVLRDFGLTNCASDACFTKANIKANFGWDDEQESCFDWSTKGASVVDTDCVVAIPKTGDASVLAWLF